MDENQNWEDFTEPPVESPEGWYGGSVEEVSAGQLYRRWRNTKKELSGSDEQTVLIVEYSGRFDKVEVVEYHRQGERYYEGETIDSELITEEGAGDRECAEVAVNLMEDYS